MASGYGYSGGPSRCFPFWQELLGCYVVNTSADDVSGAKKCGPALEDYYECLHHRKELARTRAMQLAYRRREVEGKREGMRRSGDTGGLGLLGKGEGK